MKLTDLLEEQSIIPELKSSDKKKAIEELAEAIVNRKPSLDKDSLVRVLLERETLGSTGIGEGVAIPHGKFPGLSEPIISFGRSLKGLDFDSMDGQPVHLFFLLIAPETSASIHLKALARIAKLLRNGVFRKMLMEASTREEIYEIIARNDEDF
jgi:PTS system nitrogen regulatory IIA component